MPVKPVEVVVTSLRNALLIPQQSCHSSVKTQIEKNTTCLSIYLSIYLIYLSIYLSFYLTLTFRIYIIQYISSSSLSTLLLQVPHLI